jgi:hypothetical protein
MNVGHVDVVHERSIWKVTNAHVVTCTITQEDSHNDNHPQLGVGTKEVKRYSLATILYLITQCTVVSDLDMY